MKSGAEIYNGIMREIESELTTAVLPTLKEKYSTETPEEHKARIEKYQKAFVEYDKRYQLYVQEQEACVRSLKMRAVHFVEQKANSDDRDKLQSMESTFSAS